MAGWIIQGVRGEGKGLAAVYLIKQYLSRGCPVATNMDLYLDKLMPDDNSSLVYRLPDFPRVQDLELLPPAFDPKYKGEDKNGIIVLDELALWLNSRSFKDKNRLPLINWLLLSRKDHWDLALTAQSHEMIDKQAKDTLCDFLVQATRTDRQTVNFGKSVYEFFGFSPYRKLIHKYYVYYGMSMASDHQEVWEFDGKEFYEGYDTNQRLTNQKEIFKIKQLQVDGSVSLQAKSTDMRATYTLLPASYLSGHVHIQKHLTAIENINNPVLYVPKQKITEEKEKPIAAKPIAQKSRFSPKFIMLLLGLIAYVIYRIYAGFDFSALSSPDPKTVIQQQKKSTLSPEKNVSSIFFKERYVSPDKVVLYSYFEQLLMDYVPKLGATAYIADSGLVGTLKFYQDDFVVEKFSLSELKIFGAIVIKQSFGIVLKTQNLTIPVTFSPLRILKDKETEGLVDSVKATLPF